MQTLEFRSKVDKWFMAALFGTIAIGAATVAITAWQGGPIASLAALLVFPIGLPIWLLRSTRYSLSDSHLDIRSGPFSWRVPLDQVRAISRTRNPLSSPALSLDRLRIDYGPARWIMISPEDPERFVREVDARRSPIWNHGEPTRR
jgi:PH (Pleckstrin Homology) domain-containing protein